MAISDQEEFKDFDTAAVVSKTRTAEAAAVTDNDRLVAQGARLAVERAQGARLAVSRLAVERIALPRRS